MDATGQQEGVSHMPRIVNVLRDLKIAEISLVDRGACAGPEIDPETGLPVQRARVALFKRDDSAADRQSFTKGEKPMGLKKLFYRGRTRMQVCS